MRSMSIEFIHVVSRNSSFLPRNISQPSAGSALPGGEYVIQRFLQNDKARGTKPRSGPDTLLANGYIFVYETVKLYLHS